MLLGRAGSGSVTNGPGEARRVSCERLRDGIGGGGRREDVDGDGMEREEEEDDSSARMSDRVDDWCEEDAGRVLDSVDKGSKGGMCGEVPLVRDLVACHEEKEGKKSDASASKGSGFHCASIWIPFSPLVYTKNKGENAPQLSKPTLLDNMKQTINVYLTTMFKDHLWSFLPWTVQFLNQMEKICMLSSSHCLSFYFDTCAVC